MTIKNFLAGIEILRKYSHGNYPLSAEHDVIYFNVDKPVSEEDRLELEKLDWLHADYYNENWYAYI